MLSPASSSALFTGPHEMPCSKAGRLSPAINGCLGPVRHRHRAHAVSLPQEIYNYPAAIALLDILDLQRRQLGAAQPVAQQQRLVALAFERTRQPG